MGSMTLNLTRVPLFAQNLLISMFLRPAGPKNSSCASKLLLLRYKLVILQCLCQVSLGLKEVQMGAHDFKLKMFIFLLKRPVNINVLRSAAPKIALVSASRYKLPYI